MLSEMKPWKPMSYGGKGGSLYDDPFYDEPEDDYNPVGSYIV
jgi:hypothetical protein